MASDRLTLLAETAFRALKARSISWQLEGARIAGSGHHNDSTFTMLKPCKSGFALTRGVVSSYDSIAPWTIDSNRTLQSCSPGDFPSISIGDIGLLKINRCSDLLEYIKLMIRRCSKASAKRDMQTLHCAESLSQKPDYTMAMRPAWRHFENPAE